MGHTKLFDNYGNGTPWEIEIIEVTLDHETSCFYGLWTSDPICTSVGLVALWLWWHQGNWKAIAQCFEI